MRSSSFILRKVYLHAALHTVLLWIDFAFWNLLVICWIICPAWLNPSCIKLTGVFSTRVLIGHVSSSRWFLAIFTLKALHLLRNCDTSVNSLNDWHRDGFHTRNWPYIFLRTIRLNIGLLVPCCTLCGRFNDYDLILLEIGIGNGKLFNISHRVSQFINSKYVGLAPEHPSSFCTLLFIEKNSTVNLAWDQFTINLKQLFLNSTVMILRSIVTSRMKVAFQVEF